MSWTRVDDTFYDHPKFLALSLEAVGLWVSVMAWCNRHHTDGIFPESCLKRFRVSNRTRGVRELIDAGLWVVEGGGYRVHDFLDYNPSAAEKKADREAAKARMARVRSRKRSLGVRANTERSSREVRSTPTRPDPDHQQVDDERAPERAPAPAPGPHPPPEADPPAEPPPVQPPSMTRCPPGTSLPDVARDDLAAGLGVDRATVDRAHDEAVAYYVLGGGATATRERGRWPLAIRQAIVRSVRGGFASAPASSPASSGVRRRGRDEPLQPNHPEDLEYLRKIGFLT